MYLDPNRQFSVKQHDRFILRERSVKRINAAGVGGLRLTAGGGTERRGGIETSKTDTANIRRHARRAWPLDSPRLRRAAPLGHP
jgi:hypothetical protein